MENGTAGPGAAAAPKKPKLTRLKVESFRNVEPCELRFGDGFNVLLGLNATGKTTLLELIAAALSFDFSKFKEEAFAVEYELAFSAGTIVASMRNERVERHTLDPEDPILDLSARLHVNFSDPPETWTVCADMSSVWIEDSPNVKLPLRTHLGERGPGLLLRSAQIDTHKSLFSVYEEELGSWEKASRFDEALDVFQSITGALTWLEASIDPADSTAITLNVAGVFPPVEIK